MLTFEEYAAAAKRVEHITNCQVALGPGDKIVRILVESFLANDDGSTVERGRAMVEMTAEQYESSRIAPGPWLCTTFDRAIAEKWQGYARYATVEEIAAYKSAKGVA